MEDSSFRQGSFPFIPAISFYSGYFLLFQLLPQFGIKEKG